MNLNNKKVRTIVAIVIFVLIATMVAAPILSSIIV